MTHCAEGELGSKLREKLASSLESLERTRELIPSINKKLVALENADVRKFLISLKILPRNALVVPHAQQEGFIDLLQSLCGVRRSLNEYKATKDSLAALNVDFIIKEMEGMLEIKEAKHKELLGEFEHLRTE